MSFVVDAVKSVGKAIGNVVSGVVKAVTSVVKAVVDIAASVVNFIAQPFMGMFGGSADIPSAEQEAQRQQGVLVQREGSTSRVPVVYGYRKLAGTVTFAETGSNNNKYLYVAYVFSEGVVEGLREVFIDDWQLPVELTADLNAGRTVAVNTDRYKDRVLLEWYPGSYFKRPQDSPVGASVARGIFQDAPSFTENMVYNGLAVLFARYEWKQIETQEDADNNPFSGNIPQVQVGLLGKKVASLLIDAEQYQYEQAGERYSTNPAECLLDYLRNPRYGKGLLNRDFDWDSWKRSARKCNQTVTYLDSRSDITGPILTCNAVVDTGQTLMNNTKNFLQNFRAYMPYVQGKYKLRIEDAGNLYDITSGVATIAATFTPDNIVGSVSYTGIERSNKYNSVAVNYVDPDQKFSVQQVIFPETEQARQVFIDRDGGRVNRQEATFSNITNFAIAKDMARLLFNKSRRQETASLTVTSQALELEPGDSIRIQSNILNFGDDPWRIISFKVNDNMTVQLSCVRNPDDIYPYVRAGEEDFVLPTYVPKGSTIYFPSSRNRPALGLVPPTQAVYPEDFAASPVNPGPTNPNAPGGGGPGGGAPPSQEGAGPVVPPEEDQPPVPTPTPVPPDNTPAEPPPPPPAFRARLEFVRTELVQVTETTYNYTVVFRQPEDGLYERSTFWWRYNQYTPYTEIRLDTLPGAGRTLSVNVGVLPLGQYEFVTRSYATDGRASILINEGQFQSRESLTDSGQFVGGGGASKRQVSKGWQIPQAPQDIQPHYDDDIDLFRISPVLDQGEPLDPRKMTVSIAQIDQFIGDKRVNGNIIGARVYYKNRLSEYYQVEDVDFPQDYSIGQTVTKQLEGSFGARQFPQQVQGSNTQGFQASTYDFVVRLRYRDGVTAERQLVFSTLVEGQFGVLEFTREFQDQTREIPQSFDLKTTDDDPNKGYNSSLEIVPNFQRIDADYTENKLLFSFTPPSGEESILFAGYKIRYREIQPGAAPPFQEKIVGPGVTRGNLIQYTIQDNTFRLNTAYEFVITAQALQNGERVDCVESRFAKRVIIPFNFYLDELQLFNFETVETEIALRQLKRTFPSTDSINVVGWDKIQNTQRSSQARAGYAFKGQQAERIYYLNTFFRLQFEHPTADTLVVYRRQFDSSATSGINKKTVTGFGKYYKVGVWDRVEIPLSDLTAEDGVYTVHLRLAVNQNASTESYFNWQYETNSLNTNLVEFLYGDQGAFPDSSRDYALQGIYPYRGDLNPRDSDRERTQFYCVVSTNGVEQDKGVLLTDFYTYWQGREYRRVVDGFGVGNVERNLVVEKSQFNSIESGYGRQLQEAIDLGMGKNDLTKFNIGGRFRSVVPKLGWSGYSYSLAPFEKFLQPPETGEDIY